MRRRRSLVPLLVILLPVLLAAGIWLGGHPENLPDPVRETLVADSEGRVYEEAIDTLGYSPNRAARQLRTRSSHLIGLRFEEAPEGTSNALMDRFLHSLVEAASRTTSRRATSPTSKPPPRAASRASA